MYDTLSYFHMFQKKKYSSLLICVIGQHSVSVLKLDTILNMFVYIVMFSYFTPVSLCIVICGREGKAVISIMNDTSMPRYQLSPCSLLSMLYIMQNQWKISYSPLSCLYKYRHNTMIINIPEAF